MAMGLFQLLPRPVVILKGQAWMENTGMQGALGRLTARDPGCWRGKAKCHFPGSYSLVTAWENTIAEECKEFGMWWDWAGAGACEQNKGAPGHPFISGINPPGHWWPQSKAVFVITAHVLSPWPWVKHLIFLCLSFLMWNGDEGCVSELTSALIKIKSMS